MELKKRQQLIIKIVCVIAAFGLWLYISNTDNNIISYTVKNVKVELINVDVLAQYKLAEMPTSEYTVNLTVKVLASDVKTIKPDNFKVVADMAGYSLKKGENRIPFEVKIKPDNVTVVIVSDMRVRVNLDDLLEKTVPVKIEISGKPKTGFQALNPIVKPTDVLIRGAAQYVNKVTKVVAKCNVAGLDKDANLIIPLIPKDAGDSIIEHVSVIRDYAEISIPIKKVKTVGVNIKTKGVLLNGTIFKAAVPIPDKVDIAGNEADLQGIDSIDTEVIDLSKIRAESYQNGTLEAKLVVPENIKLVNSNGTINYKIDNSKIIQKTLNLDIQYKNSNLFIVKPDKAQLILVVSGEESVMNKLTSADILCYIDLSAATEGDIELPVLLGNLPDGVSKVSATPATLRINIIKKPKV
jgi:YbbR domain-containing protein